MVSVTLSDKFQVTIPYAIREELGLIPGQEFLIFSKDGLIQLEPVRNIKEMRGILRGANTHGYRDH